MLEVVTVWAPRPQHEKWREGNVYLELLSLQRQTCQRQQHRHVVVTDTELSGYETIRAELPEPLLHAIISGQIAFLEQWDDAQPVVLLDIDCLVVRDLNKAFDGTWDVGLTIREHPTQPIQNGAMYFAPGARKAGLKMLRRTLELCEHWWGSDQEALAKAVAPVPRIRRIEERFGARFCFLPCEYYNRSAKHGVPHPEDRGKRFIFHFKGEAKQHAARAASRHFLLPGAQ